jgi:DNA modification methylase
MSLPSKKHLELYEAGGRSTPPPLILSIPRECANTMTQLVERMSPYQAMKLVTKEDYHRFLKNHSSISIENVNVKLHSEWKISEFQPKDYKPEEWTVWSFPDRGDWATHTGNYRGNWSPYIPRNLIDHYTKVGDLVCDPMMGSGTALVECKLMGRDAIGVDVNLNAVMVAMNRLDFTYLPLDQDYKQGTIQIYQGDARNLDRIRDGEVDLVATHPPYCGIVPYTKSQVGEDLSALKMPDFMSEMGKVAHECFRILKPNRYCAILIGDTRKHRHYIPINIGVLCKFLESGFILKEDIIKLQHKTKSTREKWRGHKYDFYKIAHEHLYVFRKPTKDERISDFKYSVRWW